MKIRLPLSTRRPAPKPTRPGHIVEPLEGRIAPALTVVPVSPTLAVDTDGDGVADPGDRLHYSVTVSNTGGSAETNVTFEDIINDPNLTLVAGSINVSPLAIDDTYTAVGNTLLKVGTNVAGTGPAATNATKATANDVEFLSDTSMRITQVNANSTLDGGGSTITITTTNGGTVTMTVNGADMGSFSYLPAAGFTGADSFTYLLKDSGIDGTPGNADDLASTSAATVNISVANKVWYVDSTAGTTGDGRSNAPFDSLADVTGATGPDTAGDIIFVRTGSGNYDGGIALLGGQTLWGENEALVVGGFTLQAAGSDPTIVNTGAGGHGVTLAGGSTNNTLKGFTIGNTNGFDITSPASAIGTLTVSNVILTGTGGLVNITNGGAMAVTLDSASTTSASGHGFNLQNTTGSFTVSAGSLSGVAGTDLFIDGTAATNTVAVSFAPSITSGVGGSVEIAHHATGAITLSGALNITGGSGISVHDNTGGTISFSNASKVVNTGANTAVNLATNAGATINFTGGGLDIDTTSGNGFVATGGGTVTVQGANNTILANGSGTALNVTGTTIGAVGAAPETGLRFQSIGAGTGAGSAGIGIILDTTGSNGGLTVTGTGSAGSGGTIQHKTGADNSLTSGIGIYLNNTSHVSLTRMQLNDFDNSAIRGFSVTHFTLTNSVINGVNGNASGPTEGAITFGTSNPSGANGLLGTGANASLIDNVDVSGAVEHTIEVYNQSGSFGLTIQNSNIHDNSVALGSDGIQMEMQGTATGTVKINNNTFSNNKSQAIQLAANDSSTLNATIQGNTVTRGTQGNEGIVLSNGSNGNLTALIGGSTLAERNTISGFGGVSIFVGQTAGNATSSSLLQATITNNSITTPTTATNHAIIAFLTSTVGQVSQARLLINNNVITQASTSGVARGILVDTPDTSTSPNFDATVTGNTVHVMDNVAGVGGIVVQARKASTGHFDVSGNTVDFPNGTPGGVLGLRVRQADTATAQLARGGSASNDPAVVVAANNPASTTEILGTVSVINNGIVQLPSTPPLPLLFAPTAEAAVIAPVVTEPVVVTPPVIDEATPSAPLPATQAPTMVDDGILSQAELDSLVGAAIARWEATGLTPEQSALLHAVTFTIGDLPGWYLGQAEAGRVVLDRDAAGNAWFIDPTPNDDSEFAGSAATADGGAKGRLDALTTVIHELGHQLGIEDSYAAADAASVMYGYLHQSERRLPTAHQADGAVPGANANGAPDFLFSPMSLGTLPAGKSVTIVYDYNIKPLASLTPSVGLAPTVSSRIQVNYDTAQTVQGTLQSTQLDGLTLGDRVFIDDDSDNVFSAADTGVNGVTVSLYADNGTTAGSFDAGDTLVATTTTVGAGASAGTYSFAGLLPGEYIVQLAQANFNAGGVLAGRVSLTGAPDPDNNTDNDDNGAPLAGQGVVSSAITLTYDGEVTADGTGKLDINNTLDFGFFSGTLSATLDGSGNLTIADIDAAGKANTLTVKLINSGASLEISDANEKFILEPTTVPASTLSADRKTLTIPLSAVTGSITLDTAGGTDAVTLDLAGGDFINAGGIDFNGGNPSAGPGDKLTISGGSQGTVTYNYTDAHSGNIVMSTFGTVRYTGLEPITNTGDATGIIFNLPGGAANTVTLGDDGNPGNGLVRLSSTGPTFEQTDFKGPSGSVAIYRGTAGDTVTVNTLAEFSSGLFIGATSDPFATITLAGALTLASGNGLAMVATNVNVGASGSATVSGGGAITFFADNVDINTASAVLNAGTGQVVFNTLSNSRPINLGTNVGTALSLTDLELDRITGGTLSFGLSSSGTITISDAISRTAATGLALTTGAGNIVFGALGSLNAGAATVTLLSETGNIQGDAAALTNVTATTLSATASTGIGATNGIESAVSTFTFANTTNAVLVTNTLAGGLTVSGTNAGTGVVVISESLGNLTVDAADIVTNSGAVALTATNTNRSVSSASGANVQTTGGATAGAGVFWGADNISLGGNIIAGTGLVTLTPTINATAINLGGVVSDSAGVLGLTEAELNRVSTSGGLFIGSTTNTGGITVAGAANLTTASVGGTVTLRSNSGNIAVNAALTTPAAATLQTTSGNISFGAAGTITANGGSTVTLSAVGGNIAGDAAAFTNVTANSLSATASSGIGATNAIETAVSNLSFANTTNAVQVTNALAGGVTVSGTNAGIGAVNITETSGNLTVGASDIVTNSGAVSLTASGLNKSIISAAGSDVQTTGGATPGANVTWTADNIDLAGLITAGSGLVTLKPQTNATAIQVGSSATDGAGTLGLTDVELNRVSTTGGLFIGATTNTGGITVSGAANLTTVGGTVTLRSNSGSIAVDAALTAPASATLQTTSGNISFGASGRVTVNGSNSVTLSAVGGNIEGDAAAFNNVTAASLLATASSGIGATNAIESAVQSLHFFNTTNGVQVTNTRAAGLVIAIGVSGGAGTVSITETLGDISIPTADIVTNSGIVNLTASGLNRSIRLFTGFAVQTTGGATAGANVNLTADHMELDGNIIAGTATTGGTVTLKQATDTTTAINLGSIGGPTPNLLEISDAELDAITAPQVVIGNANSGAVTISAVISPLNYKTLSIQKGASFTATGGFDSDLTSATVYEKMIVNGAVVIDPAATFTVAAVNPYVPATADSFTIIDNTSASTTTGTFSGKPEGFDVPIGGTAVTKKITYMGGTNNDVVLIGTSVSVAVGMPSSVAENSGTGLVYTFTRVGDTSANLPVNFSVSGLAALTADYTASSLASGFTFNAGSGTITIPAGQASASLTLTPANDTKIEGDETAVLTVAAGTNYSPDSTPATGTITDNDTASISIAASPSVTEQGGSQNVTVTLTTIADGVAGAGTLERQLTADVVDAGGGTATGAGTDYTAFGTQPVTFIIGSGNNAMQTVALVAVNDSIFENDETVKLTLQNASGPSTIGNANSTVTITDNETASLAIAATPTVAEQGGAQNIAVTMTITGDAGGTATLGAGVSLGADVVEGMGSTALSGTDFTAFGTQPVTFTGALNTGATQNVTLTPTNDALIEGNETVNLTLQNLAATFGGRLTLGNTSSAVTIDDNDTATLAITASGNANEQGGAQTFNVTLATSDGAGGTATLAPGISLSADVIDLLTGTAISDTDYNALSTQTVTFTSGNGDGATQSFTLTPKNDSLLELTETVKLKLQNLSTTLDSQAALGNVDGTLSILDDENATLAIATTANVSEGGGAQPIGVTLTITGSSATADPFALGAGVSLTADVVDAGTGNAVSGTDYTAFGTQMVTFDNGDATGTVKNVSLAPIPNGNVDVSRTVNLTLQNLGGSAVTKALGNTGSAVSIIDDDGVDLKLGKAGDVMAAAPGDVIKYTLSYRNGGFVTAAGVKITDTIPANTVFDLANSTAGWQDTGGMALADGAVAGTAIKFPIGSLPVSMTDATVVLAVKVNATVAAGVATVDNTAVIADDGAGGGDISPLDNMASASTPLDAAPDLAVTSKSDGLTVLVPGATHTYTIDYANVGNQGATGVFIEDPLPVGTSFVMGENPGWVNNAGVLTFNVGNLAAAATGSATLILHMDAPLPVGVISVSNTATIKDDDANGADPAGNDSSTDVDVQSIPVTLVNARTARFTDVDGDLITVTVSKGTLEQSDFLLVPAGLGGQLMLVNFSDDGTEFKGANLTINSAKRPGGDGFVNVGAVNAAGVDLGAVRVDGDLGQIDAGDADVATTGLQNLVVGSLGRLTGTQPGGTPAPLHSEVVGKLGSLVSRGTVGGVLDVAGGVAGSIDRINILGSLDGSAGGVEAGLIRASGAIGPVTASGITGGADFSGVIAGGKLGKVTVKGDLASADAARPVLLAAKGITGATSQYNAIAIGGLQVFGSVNNARVLAGYEYSPGLPAALVASNPDAAIGAISVKGDWTASSAVAGVADVTADGFGRNDALIAGDTTANIIASIASIMIKGAASGTALGGDFFGLTAQHLSKVKIGTRSIALTASADAAILDTTNLDFTAVDFA